MSEEVTKSRDGEVCLANTGVRRKDCQERPRVFSPILHGSEELFVGVSQPVVFKRTV